MVPEYQDQKTLMLYGNASNEEETDLIY
jgi:hypothetical protein